MIPRLIKLGCLCFILILAACTARVPPSSSFPGSTGVKPVRITHITHAEASPELMLYALSLVGTPYRYGGQDKEAGFDCSGLVGYVYQNTLGVALPRTARDMAASGIPVAVTRLQVGDLVFFNTTGQPFSHVGIYLGEGRFLHAPNSRSVVNIGSLNHPYWHKQLTGARSFFVK